MFQILKIAVNLEIFDVLKGRQSKTASEIATQLHLDANRLDRLLRSLVCLELLDLVDNGKLKLRTAKLWAFFRFSID